MPEEKEVTVHSLISMARQNALLRFANKLIKMGVDEEKVTQAYTETSAYYLEDDILNHED